MVVERPDLIGCVLESGRLNARCLFYLRLLWGGSTGLPTVKFGCGKWISLLFLGLRRGSESSMESLANERSASPELERSTSLL